MSVRSEGAKELPKGARLGVLLIEQVTQEDQREVDCMRGPRSLPDLGFSGFLATSERCFGDPDSLRSRQIGRRLELPGQARVDSVIGTL